MLMWSECDFRLLNTGLLRSWLQECNRPQSALPRLASCGYRSGGWGVGGFGAPW